MSTPCALRFRCSGAENNPQARKTNLGRGKQPSGARFTLYRPALRALSPALQWGKDAEASARPAEALELYHTGLAALVAHIRVEPDPAKREILTGVINDMMANAERLKTEFTLDGDGAAGDSTPHRVYIHGSIYALTFSKNSWTFSRDLQTLQHV